MASTFADRLPSPPREFSLMPFWFWNDQLDETELLRQIANFEAHGVYGFVIHPRMGLPRNIGWMSDELLRFMQIAIEEAERRDMRVILYDEGMYPSGSSSGQVAAEDPTLACRCLAVLEPSDSLPGLSNVVARVARADGEIVTVIDTPADSYIRGIHYQDEEQNIEDEPVAGDILNPRTAASILRLVYERFFDRFGKHFGKTIIGIFTDEPNTLGKARNTNMRPGTTGILADVSSRLGYDFTPYLPALWFDEPDAQKHRADYDWAIHRRLEETWYRPLSQWCEDHGVALCGHPDRGDEIGVQKFFHFPGQDLVWRWVLPEHTTALEGPESTQAKCSSSAMIHYGRRRNSNEFCGAYGHETTFDEFKWLANWCLVRGVNLLIPHAFYYSIRGPRRDERPPQVGGVGCPWWGDFKPFADHCRFLSWLNTDSEHLCEVAILAPPDHCPWAAAKICLEHQIDFNYLDVALLDCGAKVDAAGVHLAGMTYAALILEDSLVLREDLRAKLAPMIQAERVAVLGGENVTSLAVCVRDPKELVSFLTPFAKSRPIMDSNSPALRIRQIRKDGSYYCMFFNEGIQPICTDFSLVLPQSISSSSHTLRWISSTGQEFFRGDPLYLTIGSHEMTVLMAKSVPESP